MSTIDDPITAPAPEEVPLPNAPLVRVIAQVRFPHVIDVDQREFVAPFQKALRSKYPVLRPEQMQGVLFGPNGPAAVQAQTAWRFSDADGKWRVSLAPEFTALETTEYSSRTDFLGRLREVLEALQSHVAPQLVDRLGLRYIDRITGAAVEEISKLVNPAVLGITTTAAAMHAEHVLGESLFALDDTRLRARWGRLPRNGTVDPAALEPIDDVSWILDLDMFTTKPQPFDVEAVMASADSFAARLYTFFRWVVTPEFLRRYGGNV